MNITHKLLSCVVAGSLSLFAFPAFSLADVRKSDLIDGISVEDRGLSVAQCPSIDADFAYLMDSNGNTYFARKPNEETKIASITKVMTALVVLNAHKPNLSITVSQDAASVGESSARLVAGDVLSIQDALLALMLSSGNDAAYALAENFGQEFLKEKNSSGTGEEAVQAFVERMNGQAQELHMDQSVFANPHGLDDGKYEGNHHSTAHDVALMIKAAMEIPEFRELVNKEQAVIHPTREGVKTDIELKSTDVLLGEFEGACGVKTGFTNLAGPSFAGANQRGDTLLLSAVIHSSSESARFTDTKTLMSWAYEHLITYKLAHTPHTVSSQVSSDSQVPLVAEVAALAWIDKTIPATFKDTNATVRVFDLNGNVSQEVQLDQVQGGVRAGDKLGEVVFKQRNQIVARQDLVAAEDVPAPNIFQGIGIWWDRFFRNMNGQATHAENQFYNETPLIFDKTQPQAGSLR